MTTANKGLNQPGYNTNVNTWGTGPLNDNFGYIDLALGGSTLLNATGLGGTTVNLTQAQCRPLALVISGVPGGTVTYTVPSGVGGFWIVRNTSSSPVAIVSLAGGATATVPAGSNLSMSCDGTSTGIVLNDTATPNAAGSNTQVQFNSSGVLGASANLTFNGTTLTTTGLNNTGNTVLGDAAGDTLTINSNAAAIPNGLNIGSNTLYLAASGAVGIGTTTLGSDKLVVAGTIKSTSGGFVFPDGTSQSTAATLPSGTVVAYALPAAPTGFLLCYGQAVNKADYPSLDAAFFANGYPYGSTTLTFTLPDLRGRVVAGVDNMGGSSANRLYPTINSGVIGSAGGQQTVTLSINEMPSHDHAGGDYGHGHTIPQTGLTGNNSGLGGTGGGASLWQNSSVAGGTDTGYANIYISARGGSQPHLNVQPTIVLYYIIKT